MKFKDESISIKLQKWFGAALLVPVLVAAFGGAAMAKDGGKAHDDGGGISGPQQVPEPEWFNLIGAGLVPLGFYLGRRTWPGSR